VPDGAVVLRGAAVMAVVAFLVNDSGLVIPAFVALVLAPLLVAAGAEDPRSVSALGRRLDELDEDAAGVLGVDEVHP
jgi:hypothetical protein